MATGNIPSAFVPRMEPWFIWPVGQAQPFRIARPQTLIEAARAFVRNQLRAEARRRLAQRRQARVPAV